MWFKQARIFNLSGQKVDNIETLTAGLESLRYQPCLPSLAGTQGFCEPCDYPEAPLVYANSEYALVCLQIEDKLLPSSVIGQQLQEQVKQREVSEARKLSSQEKKRLRDDITQTLLPKAFSRLSKVYGYIDLKHQQLALNTTVGARCDGFVSMLKRALPGLSIRPVKTKKMSKLLTRWLTTRDYPKSFDVEKHTVLVDPNHQQRTVRCQQQDLFASSIQSLLKEGCEVSQLALHWQDKIRFTLTTDLHIKSLKYSDELLSLAKDEDMETAEQRFAADFLLMTEWLTALWQELLELFAAESGAESELALDEGVMAEEALVG